MDVMVDSPKLIAKPEIPPDLLDSIVSALILIDLKGCVLQANLAASAVIGQEDLPGRNYAELLRFRDFDPVAEFLEKREPLHRVEAAGQGRLWGVTISPYRRRGRLRGALIGFRDLTEHKRMEELLAASQREATIGRLAATVAHEINNPLGAIKAHLRILEKQMGGEGDCASKESLEIVQEQVDRIARTVRVLLGFSRERSAPEKSVSIEQIIDTVCELFSVSFEEKGVELILDLPAEPSGLKADADQMQELLVNLLENARSALRRGDRLVIKLERRPGEIELILEDTGPGLGPDPEMIFEPFYTTKAWGTGLGLPIARKVCEAHGGKLLAENRKDVPTGARFRVILRNDE